MRDSNRVRQQAAIKVTECKSKDIRVYEAAIKVTEYKNKTIRVCEAAIKVIDRGQTDYERYTWKGATYP